MQRRPETEPTSWLYQANIHGAAQGAAQTAWNTCQHGSWYFLSWHRMYLYYFEKILRDASTDNQLALPYWNYSDQNDANARQIPEPYRQPANSTANPLFVADRNAAMNAGGLLPESTVSLDALNRINFSSPAGSGLSFGGQRSGPGHSLGPHSLFESTPHDAVHIDVGGWMASFNTAARDPVFWLHHCNIDRLWESWLALGGGRANPTPPQGDPWLSQTFEFYDVTSAGFVTLTGAEILNTASQLNYTYESLSTPEAEEEFELPVLAQGQSPKVLADMDASAKTLRDEPVSFDLEVIEEEGEPQGELVLRLEDVEIEDMPQGHYEVYANLPEGQTPDHRSVYFLGNMSFFGLAPRGQAGGHSESASAAYTFSLAKLERDLKSKGQWTGDVKVTFVKASPQPPPGVAIEEAEPAAVHIGRIKVTRE